MAGKTRIPKRDAERARKVLEIEREKWPTYKRPSYLGSYMLLILFLAVVGYAVYYSLNHKEQVSELWNRVTHRNAAPAQVEPGQ